MKFRHGFVSNSSTSSFIIALKRINEPCPHCGRKDPDFLDMVEKSSEYMRKNYVCTSNTEDTLDYLELNEKNWMDEKDYQNLMSSLEKYRNKEDWTIANINLSNHDEEMRKVLYELVERGNAEVLWKTEC